MRPDYSVVVLTWNSRRYVKSCLASLAAAAPRRAGQLIVVDNGSRDGTLDVVREVVPAAEVVSNRQNRGVAAGRNQGLARVRAPFALLLDVDTVVEPGAFDRLLDFLGEEGRVGLCGPRLVLPDGSIQPSCQRFPTVRDKLARQLPRRLSARLLRDVELADWDHRGTRDVDFVVGACQVIRMSALAEVGWLDERIFYGPEDIDLCLRMKLAGWRVCYMGDAVVHHECQRATRWRISMLTWRHAFGLVHFYRRHGYLWSRAGLYRRLSAAERFEQRPVRAGEGGWESVG
jgi:GT2 family glycosyltransferase